MIELNNFDALKIGLASPAEIRSWSRGEVKKPETINDVIRHDLCNRCGSCVGLSGGKIVFEDRTGKYLPVIKEPLDIPIQGAHFVYGVHGVVGGT